MHQKFYESKKWQSKKNIILRNSNYLCQNCKRYGLSNQAQSVHHITPLDIDFSKRFKSDNLVALCRPCHNKCHNRLNKELTDFGKSLL